MRLVAQPQINTKPCEAVAASIGGWLSALLIWVVEVYDALPPSLRDTPPFRAAAQWAKARVTAGLRRSARILRPLIFVQAFARMKLTTRPAPMRRPLSNARGVRRARCPHVIMRRFVGGVLTGLHEGTLRQRVTRMQRVLATLPRLVTRVLARLRAMWRTHPEAALITVAAHDLCCSVAYDTAPAHADTS